MSVFLSHRRSDERSALSRTARLLISLVVLPPVKWLKFEEGHVVAVPASDGVLVLADSDEKPIMIRGVADLRAGLAEQRAAETEASYFRWEQDRMHTKRESKLIQQHLTQYGELPGGGDDELDGLRQIG